MKRNLINIILLLLSLCIISCDNLFLLKTRISITLPSRIEGQRSISDIFTQGEVTEYQVYLYQILSTNNQLTQTITGKPSEVIQFDDIEPGNYIVQIKANKDTECIAYGESETIVVTASETSTVDIKISFNSIKNIKDITLSKNEFTLGDIYFTKNENSTTPSDLVVTAQFTNGFSRNLTSDEYTITSLDAEDNYLPFENEGNFLINENTKKLCINIGIDSATGIAQYKKSFNITVNVEKPTIVTQTCNTLGEDITLPMIEITLNVTSNNTTETPFICNWYRSTKSENIIAEDNLIFTSEVYSEKENLFTFPVYETTEEGTTNIYYYQAEIINENANLNGKQTESVLTQVFGDPNYKQSGTVISTEKELNSIQASYKSEEEYILASSDTVNLKLENFLVSRYYSDGTEETGTPTEENYNVDFGEWAENTVGTRTVTITDIKTSISTKVSIEYKYALDSITATLTLENNILKCSNYECPVYMLGTEEITNTISYSWWYCTESDGSFTEISDATTLNYTPTETGYYYCKITVEPSNSDYCNTIVSESTETLGFTTTSLYEQISDTELKIILTNQSDITDLLQTAINNSPTTEGYTITLYDTQDNTYYLSSAILFVKDQDIIINPADGINITICRSTQNIQAFNISYASLTLGSSTGTGTLTLDGKNTTTNTSVINITEGLLSINKNVTIINENQVDNYCGGNIVVNNSEIDLNGCTLKSNFSTTTAERSSIIELQYTSTLTINVNTTITSNTAQYFIYFNENNTGDKLVNWVGGTITDNSFTTTFSNVDKVTNTSGNSAS